MAETSLSKYDSTLFLVSHAFPEEVFLIFSVVSIFLKYGRKYDVLPRVIAH